MAHNPGIAAQAALQHKAQIEDRSLADECWNELIDAIEMNEAEIVVERAKALSSWMNRKGFMPTVKHDQLDFLIGFIADEFRKKVR